MPANFGLQLTAGTVGGSGRAGDAAAEALSVSLKEPPWKADPLGCRLCARECFLGLTARWGIVMSHPRTCCLLLALLFAGCGDDEVVERVPIRPFMLQYTDPVIKCILDPGEPGYVAVGALVGYDGCELESTEIKVRGDSLFVTGVAKCVSKPDSKPFTPPARPNLQHLSIQLPDLGQGRYTVCAGGLCGQISVTTACRPAMSIELYAYGNFTMHDSCLVFTTPYGFRSYEAWDIELPGPEGLVRIDAAPWGSAVCDTLLDGIIRVWSVEVHLEPNEFP